MRATATAAENSSWSFPRERQATREAILSAARSLAEREGVEAVTLSAVARETGIVRAVIYSHFSRRQDLVAALEEAGAKASPDSVPNQEDDKAPPKETTSEIAAEAPPVVDTGSDNPQPAQEPVEQTTPESGGYDAVIQTQVDALRLITSQVPNTKHETETALSGMNARLANTEQSFAALEHRVDEQLKSLAGQTGSLAKTVSGLRTRLEKFELRQQTALADLRQDIHSLVHPGEPARPPAELQPELPFESIEEDVEIELVIEDPPLAEPEADTTSVPGYLATARQAAIKAANKTAAPQRRRFRPKSELMRRLWRNRWAVLIAVTVVVVAFDSWVFANTQPVPAVVPIRAATVAVAQPKHILTPHAQLVRGLKYLNGAGVPVNVAKARALLERAAQRGEPVAQNLMGVLYQTGTGVPADIVTAIRWYETSAQHGNLKAMTNLGKLYAGGWKEGTDFVKAAEWFSKAASYGDVDAQFDLAILYERGEGVSRNMSDAYKWYSIAARNGDSHAADRAGALATQLDAEELQATDAAVAMFKPIAIDHAANDVPQTNS